MKRDELYERINKRVDKMIIAGFIEEVKKLVSRGYTDCNSLNTVGYREIIKYLNNEKDLTETITLIKQNSRRYAKRQLTWFKKDTSISWCELPDPSIIDKISQFISERK
jgi:tRNA dimethylallyltransferase